MYVQGGINIYISSVFDIVPKTAMQGEIELVMHRGITISQ